MSEMETSVWVLEGEFGRGTSFYRAKLFLKKLGLSEVSIKHPAPNDLMMFSFEVPAPRVEELMAQIGGSPYVSSISVRKPIP